MNLGLGIYIGAVLLICGCHRSADDTPSSRTKEVFPPPVTEEMAWATTDAGIQDALASMADKQSRYEKTGNALVAKLITPEIFLNEGDKIMELHQTTDPYYVGSSRFVSWGVTRKHGVSEYHGIDSNLQAVGRRRSGMSSFSGATFPLGKRGSGIYAIACVVYRRKSQGKKGWQEPTGLKVFHQPAIALVRVKPGGHTP